MCLVTTQPGMGYGKFTWRAMTPTSLEPQSPPLFSAYRFSRIGEHAQYDKIVAVGQGNGLHETTGRTTTVMGF